MKRLICKLLGHRFDQEAARYHVFHCERCGHDAETYTQNLFEILTIWWYWKRCNIRCKVHDLRNNWWRCEDCGGWFGNHDEKNCIPF